MKRLLTASATALALGMGGNAYAGTVPIDIDGDTRAGGSVFVDLLDWAPDNLLFRDIVPIPGFPGLSFGTLYGQGSIGTFKKNGANVASPMAGEEWTFQFEIEILATVGTVFGGTEFAIQGGTGSPGSFEIYFDNPGTTGSTGGVFHDDVTGAGYGDGRLILAGHWDDPATLFGGTLDIGSVDIGDLDQFGTTNDQAPITTHEVGGSFSGEIEIDFMDPTFFLNPGIDLDDDNDLAFFSDNVAPFRNANPSDAVVGWAPDYGSDGVNNNTCGAGGTNPGGPNDDRCDIHAEGDSRSPFKASFAPEPSSLAILGLGLLGLGAVQRRNRKS